MDFNKATPTGSFAIQGKAFQIPKPFNDGHVCTSSEAGVLNQILAENTRNNWASRIKKDLEEGTFDQTKIQAEIDEYLENYEFGVRRGRGPSDPVEREALNMAKDIVKVALRENNHKLSDVAAEDINRLAEEAVAANPDITKEAKRRVDQRTKLGVGELDLSSVGNEATEEAA